MNGYKRYYYIVAKEQIEANYKKDRNAWAYAKDMFNLRQMVGE